MKAYVLTTKNSTRLKEGKIENYPSCLPEPKIVYGPTPEEGCNAPEWYKPTLPDNITNYNSAWCCYQGHLNILKQHLKEYPDEDCLLLEDDVIFHQLFDDLYDSFIQQLPENWSFVSLGGLHASVPVEKVENVLKAFKIYGFECFIIRHTVLKDTIDYLDHPESIENPTFDASFTELFKKHICYTPVVFFAGQKSGYSSILGSNRELGINRVWHKYITLSRTVNISSDGDYLRYLHDYSKYSATIVMHGGIGTSLYELAFGNYLKVLGMTVKYKLYDDHPPYTIKFMKDLGIEFESVPRPDFIRYKTKEEYTYHAIVDKEINGYPFYNELIPFVKFNIPLVDAIGVHIRRGDFKQAYRRSGHNKQFYDLCKTDYYYKVKAKCDSIKLPIIVFTDFIDEVPDHIKELFKDAEWCTDTADKAFYKLAACKIKFIANSTFSTWAAHATLNSTVYYPKGFIDNKILARYIPITVNKKYEMHNSTN